MFPTKGGSLFFSVTGCYVGRRSHIVLMCCECFERKTTRTPAEPGNNTCIVLIPKVASSEELGQFPAHQPVQRNLQNGNQLTVISWIRVTVHASKLSSCTCIGASKSINELLHGEALVYTCMHAACSGSYEFLRVSDQSLVTGIL